MQDRFGENSAETRITGPPLPEAPARNDQTQVKMTTKRLKSSRTCNMGEGGFVTSITWVLYTILLGAVSSSMWSVPSMLVVVPSNSGVVPSITTELPQAQVGHCAKQLKTGPWGQKGQKCVKNSPEPSKRCQTPGVVSTGHNVLAMTNVVRLEHSWRPERHTGP